MASRRTCMASAVSSAKRALISVSDKSNLEELARGLHNAGYELVSTGGSKATIEGFGIPVRAVEELTGFPEMMNGRVKTLHPGVHGGLLARRDDESHMAAAAENNISMIDVLVVNLYPFRATVTKPGVSYADGVENIDIGGPAMIRAAAKNHAHVSVVVDPADYADFLGGITSGGVDEQKRRYFAWKAFQHCSSYDALVSEWLWQQVSPGEMQPEVTVPMRLKEVTRYGENSHQKAAIYSDESLREHGAGGVGSAVQHHGKEMSYNNYLDAEAAFSMASDFAQPCCVIVKHTNSCGVSVTNEGRDLLEAYRCAVRADPISAFGGIVAFNTTVDEDLAREIREFRSPTDGETRMFYEIVIAPSYTEKGLEVLKGKSKTLRILEAKPRAPSGVGFRQVSAGWLSQEADNLTPEDIEFTCVSEAKPTDAQLADLKFAWLCVKHVKSNAITIAKDGRLLGMGSGQPNRVKSVEISIEKAGDEVEGSVLASDAFFPFSWGDSVEKACQAGVKAIVHPGGSMRDQDAIDCCNKYGVVLMTTGVRHFKH
jgi:phosphoribosylaminoimidazolecarboxamide formyltransferase/IMP cyclohydrolase